MNSIEQQLSTLFSQQKNANIQVRTLGTFQVTRGDTLLSDKDWGREKTMQLFEFLVTARHRRGLHKEQIIDRIWEESDSKSGDQNFKVALHGINKTLEPERKSREEPKYILRQGLTYQLQLEEIWIDADALEAFIALGNQSLNDFPTLAAQAYRAAIDLHRGIYLPNRLYEDWSSSERERIQLLALGAMITLAELTMAENPMESVRLTQKALQVDATWEDAYRIQMQAYFQKGNRPLAIKTYQQCKSVLYEEFGLKPLPETQALFRKIQAVA
ncbi:MAG: bacterial transcriptional activator domain-containing protein [Bacteroidota bacterium]